MYNRRIIAMMPLEKGFTLFTGFGCVADKNVQIETFFLHPYYFLLTLWWELWNSSSALVFVQSSSSMALSFLPYNLHYTKQNKGTLNAASVPYTKTSWWTDILLSLVSMRLCYPFEVVHVGGLHWGSYKRQVVDFCRFLAPLVWLNEHLEKYKRQTN